ncbi:hypothetical protein R4172_19075 [Rhodococcus kroppenstedtii]|uniref:hypothetical protein n=1 Tax=Rhodococcoides kroppenstedtii TaxID=293050 RepID=UPI002953EA0A|nr:hypothetical protein [Rhodococcus kroppenstedtii]MDV7199649.1 hypothetical protein [Rhodococcus kroppenstedtii]
MTTTHGGTSELITSDEAAAIMGVTPARVRQIKESGRITGIAFGSRAVLYDRGEIEAYTFARTAPTTTSGIAVLASRRPDPPLSSVENTVVDGGPDRDAGTAFHLRIFRGSDRTVVVTGPVAEATPVDPRRYGELVVARVAHRYLDGNPLAAYWIDVDPTGRGVRNHVLAEGVSTADTYPRWRRIRPSELDGRSLLIADVGVADGVHVVDRIVGTTVQHFPDRHSATRKNIAEFARTGAPVPVRYDRLGIRPLLAAASTLNDRRDISPATTDTAVRAIRSRVAALLTALADDPDPSYLVEPDWLYDSRCGHGALDRAHCTVDAVIDSYADLNTHTTADPTAPEAHELHRCWVELARHVDTTSPTLAVAGIRNRPGADGVETAMTAVERAHRVLRHQNPAIPALSPPPDATTTPPPSTTRERRQVGDESVAVQFPRSPLC